MRERGGDLKVVAELLTLLVARTMFFAVLRPDNFNRAALQGTKPR